MTAPPGDSAGIRPRLHFTPERGWLNDPHGITWVDGEYHLFYQHIPAGTQWASAVHWGHAVAPDLMHWRRLPIALSPAPDEEGCWTGAMILDDGVPTIIYTSVPADDWNLGRIAAAVPDNQFRTWTRPPNGVLIDHPPGELHARVFRDPCIVRTDAGWAMIVGVGVEEGVGLAVQYTSPDARSWTYTGVLCSRSRSEIEGVWTGGMWECPQLFRVGDDWALVVSVWDDDRLFYVAGAIGSYDGTRFTAERWSRITHDETAYAMTSFVDRSGLPCVMFWLREDPAHDPSSRPWAGALSLPMVAEVGPDRSLRLRPHPDVDALRASRAVTEHPGGIEITDASRGLDVALPAAHRHRWSARLRSDTQDLLTMAFDGGEGGLVVTSSTGERTPVPVSGDAIRIVVDSGLVEIFPGAGCASFRVPAGSETDVTMGGLASSEIRVWRLDLS
jgi:beta-fructofuranosidase